MAGHIIWQFSTKTYIIELLKPYVRTYPMDSRLKKVCFSALGAIWNIRDLMPLSAVFTLPGWCYLEAKWAIVLQVQEGENCAAETGAVGASGSQMSRGGTGAVSFPHNTDVSFPRRIAAVIFQIEA